MDDTEKLKTFMALYPFVDCMHIVCNKNNKNSRQKIINIGISKTWRSDSSLWVLTLECFVTLMKILSFLGERCEERNKDLCSSIFLWVVLSEEAQYSLILPGFCIHSQ